MLNNDSPAGSLGEHNPVRVLLGSLDKLHAGVVLPVPHGLLEQGFVDTTEVGIDLVGDHRVVPDPFGASRGRPLQTFGPRFRWGEGGAIFSFICNL